MTFRKFILAIFTVFAAQLLAAQIVFAAGSGGSGDGGSATEAESSQNADFAAGKAAIDAEQWDAAIAAFTKVTSSEPNNADAYNYLGYANRKLKNYDAAFANYNKALDIDPEHKGANEYIGEAYLQTGNLKMAEEHLVKLDALCFFGCPEYTMLKRAVEDYKAKQS
ncbi:tetratricopeptide repeat protein [Sneathiella litorea]|uniref:Tetratricopeptide repeat protein n=1 Tax=Sneathiella litorea TaxID=2606216 RepID=A0A6L8W7A7_9PROT|nr:tetratricopeptide repeat protein [Sneathiella litorea]MZR30985.1 tetratricopeptide repeat protein [Sneathiella litorea]